jgi:hypothetical protein
LPKNYRQQGARASQATSSRIAGRHHLVSPGDIISESAGDFVGICTNLILDCVFRSNVITDSGGR